MTKRKTWSREETLLAVNLYCKTPFGRIHTGNPDIVELASMIGRTASAVSWKLANFAHLDPSLERKGASNVSRLDREIWADFFNNWNALSFESEGLLSRFRRENLPPTQETEDVDFPDGQEREQTVRSRVNQKFFRQTVLAAYDSTCCITGISEARLLIASHIVPWSVDTDNRTNPRNGLCLNSLHDKAFDAGLLTIDGSGKLLLSSVLKVTSMAWTRDFFLRYEGAKLRLPKRFFPEEKFFTFHRNHIFVG
jgi:predicted restriction endonuclease